MKKELSQLSDKELKKVDGGMDKLIPSDYQSKVTCPKCGSQNFIVVKFPRMHFFCRDCENIFFLK